MSPPCRDWPSTAVRARRADGGATIASGSFRTLGMIVAPCSVRTMSEIATGVTSSLLTRAADVTLKERRPLVLMVRETPLHLGHLRTMTALAELGAIIAPPVPAFYAKPQTLAEVLDPSVADEFLEQAREYVREKPMQSVAIAPGALGEASQLTRTSWISARLIPRSWSLPIHRTRVTALASYRRKRPFERALGRRRPSSS